MDSDVWFPGLPVLGKKQYIDASVPHGMRVSNEAEARKSQAMLTKAFGKLTYKDGTPVPVGTAPEVGKEIYATDDRGGKHVFYDTSDPNSPKGYKQENFGQGMIVENVKGHTSAGDAFIPSAAATIAALAVAFGGTSLLASQAAAGASSQAGAIGATAATSSTTSGVLGTGLATRDLLSIAQIAGSLGVLASNKSAKPGEPPASPHLADPLGNPAVEEAGKRTKRKAQGEMGQFDTILTGPLGLKDQLGGSGNTRRKTILGS